MRKGYLYVLLLLLMFIWGLNVIAIKVLVEHFPPVTITSFRILTAGLVVFTVLLAKREFQKLTLRDTGLLLAIALTGVLGHHFFLAVGLAQTTASNTGLILGLVPLATSVFAMLFLGDRLTPLKLAGVLFGLTGVSFIVLNGSGGVSAVSFGDLFIFCSVLSQATSFVLIKKATGHLSSRLITGLMLLIGSLFLFLASLQLEPYGLSSLTEAPGWVWLVFFGSAVLATGVGHMVYNRSIHALGAGETAIFINLTPFFSLTGSYLFLGETIYAGQIFGFLFIVLGVVLGTGALESSSSTERVQRRA